MDLFKNSPKSICHQCFNIKEDCSRPMKSCGTDKKMHIAYVQKCESFNRPMSKTYESKSVAVDAAVDSRVDMMGGGHQLEK